MIIVKNKLLVLGDNLYYSNLIKKLKDLGFYVISIDKNKNAKKTSLSDEFYSIDIKNIERIYKLSTEKNIDGIMNLNEFGSYGASIVSKKLNLNGYTIFTSNATVDKGLMRICWKKNKLKIPDFYITNNINEAKDYVNRIGFPIVMKPTVSGGGSRGVSILKDNRDFKWAFDFAKKFALNGKIIIEKFIDGKELSVETFSINGKCFFLAIGDKKKPDLKTRVTYSINYPANISSKINSRVKNLVKEALLSLKIENGMAHTEVIVNDSGTPYLVETGARGGGGHIFHTIIEIVSGISAPLLQANWLTGSVNNIKSITQNGCCYRFFKSNGGVLKKVNGLERAKLINGVVDLKIVKKLGEKLVIPLTGHDRIGFVVTKAQNRDKAIEIADQVEDKLKFIIE